MPFIRTVTFGYNGKNLDINLNYSNVTNKFYANLPDFFMLSCINRKLQADNIDSLIDVINQAIDKYTAVKITKAKYIAIYLYSQYPGKDSIKPKSDLSTHSDNIHTFGFWFKWLVCDIIIRNDNIQLYINNAIYGPIESNAILIPWTPEREDAMKQHEKAILKIISDIFVLDKLPTTKIEEFLDKGTALIT